MSDSIWPYWKLAEKPQEGVYEVVMLAGLQTSSPAIPTDERVIYVCKSLEGGLNIAFSYKEITRRAVIPCRKNGERQ